MKNPKYKEWLSSLRKETRSKFFEAHHGEYFMENEESYTRMRNRLTYKFNHLSVQEYLDIAGYRWLQEHPMPEEEIPSPEELRITELEKELEEAKDITADKVVEFFKTSHDKGIHLNLRQIAEVVKELTVEYVVYNTYHGIDKAWILASEDEHLYTDKGLEVPHEVPGRDSELYWLLADVCWKLPELIKEHLEDKSSHIEKYYQDIEKDISKKLNK